MIDIDTAAAQRLADVQARIARAALLAGRRPEDIELIAISKTKGADAILPLIGAGQASFGENRVQEAEGKWVPLLSSADAERRHQPAPPPDLPTSVPYGRSGGGAGWCRSDDSRSNIRLHLVGQLQSNKAKEAVALFDAIHSVDRGSLIEALARAIEAAGKRPDCFIQVNIGEEAQKGGCAIDDLPAILGQARDAGLPIVGLMAVPPAEVEPAPYFALLAKLAGRHGLDRLSMGMSSDFETAVMLGATHVRVGTALFGERT